MAGSARSRVAVVGWFGSENFGDELLLHALAESLRRCGADVVVICPTPETVQGRHGYEAIPLPTRSRGLRGSLAVLTQLRSCTSVIFGPGTIFQERSPAFRWPGTLPLFLRLALLARLARSPVFIIGAAVREDTTPLGRFALRTIGRLAKMVAVRDAMSAGVFGTGSIVIGDVATAGEQPKSSIALPSARSFALSLRPLADVEEDHLGKTIRSVAQTLIAAGMNGCFIPMSLGHGARGEDDRVVHERYFKGIVQPRCEHFLNEPFQRSVHRWFDLLGEQDLLIAVRLHACIGGVLCGVPTVAISYERKVRVTFEALGLADYVVAVGSNPNLVMEVCDAARSPDGRLQFELARMRAAAQGQSIRGLIEQIARPE